MSSAQLIGRNVISNYIDGGRGVVTLESPSKKHYSYRFRYPRNRTNFDEGTMFVYVRNSNLSWSYVGMVSHGYLRVTKNSEFSDNSEEFKGAKYILKMKFQEFDTPMKLYHEGKCAYCGRPLTDPKSIRNGVGPSCARDHKLNLI